MTTKCPLCGKPIERKNIDAHIREHDRADAVERKITGEVKCKTCGGRIVNRTGHRWEHA